MSGIYPYLPSRFPGQRKQIVGQNGSRFLYERVATELRQQIAGGKFAPGDQLPPEDALAAQYNVHRHTVRRALADLEGEGIILRQRGRGTFVGAPKRQRSGPLLYVGRYTGHFFASFYSALSIEGQRAGRWVSAIDPKEAEASGDVLERVAGELRASAALLCLASEWKTLKAGLLEGIRLPVIIYDSGEPGAEPTYHVRVDRAAAARIAAEHLVRLGHSRIAFIGVHPNVPEGDELPRPLAMCESYQGFRAALQAYGLSEAGALAYYTTWEAGKGMPEDVRRRVWCGTEEEAEDLVRRFVRALGGRASAFVCDADFRAITLCHALAREGYRVPDDASVIGIGNTPWCQAVRPQLTSVSLGEEALARLAVQCALACPAESAIVYSVGPVLVERGSACRKG
jgi:DNA-binding LacI/PurR family transcriptional regulator